MYSLSVLDVTLRDGGYVNDFLFGSTTISSVLDSLSKSNVEGVELGFLRGCSYKLDCTWFNEVQQAEDLLESVTAQHQHYFLMIRPDWYDINKLSPNLGKIQNLRFAFHYQDFELLDYQVKKAQDSGYKVYLNPVNITSYTQDNLKSILTKLNLLQPKAVAIVDTFGSLTYKSLTSLCNLFDDYLDPSVSICLHPHDNLLLAFSLAQSFINRLLPSRNIWIDSSINGMGRAPGNLQSELLLNYLNLYHNCTYCLDSIYKVLPLIESKFKTESAWGYHPAYAESAFNQVHRSYPEYMIHKTRLDLASIAKVLSLLSTSPERESFNEAFLNTIINSNTYGQEN